MSQLLTGGSTADGGSGDDMPVAFIDHHHHHNNQPFPIPPKPVVCIGGGPPHHHTLSPPPLTQPLTQQHHQDPYHCDKDAAVVTEDATMFLVPSVSNVVVGDQTQRHTPHALPSLSPLLLHCDASSCGSHRSMAVAMDSSLTSSSPLQIVCGSVVGSTMTTMMRASSPVIVTHPQKSLKLALTAQPPTATAPTTATTGSDSPTSIKHSTAVAASTPTTTTTTAIIESEPTCPTAATTTTTTHSITQVNTTTAGGSKGGGLRSRVVIDEGHVLYSKGTATFPHARTPAGMLAPACELIPPTPASVNHNKAGTSSIPVLYDYAVGADLDAFLSTTSTNSAIPSPQLLLPNHHTTSTSIIGCEYSLTTSEIAHSHEQQSRHSDCHRHQLPDATSPPTELMLCNVVHTQHHVNINRCGCDNSGCGNSDGYGDAVASSLPVVYDSAMMDSYPTASVGRLSSSEQHQQQRHLHSSGRQIISPGMAFSLFSTSVPILNTNSESFASSAAVSPQRGHHQHQRPLPVASLLPLPQLVGAPTHFVSSGNSETTSISEQQQLPQHAAFTYESPPQSPASEDGDALTSDSCGWVHEGAPLPPHHHPNRANRERFTIVISLDGTLVHMHYPNKSRGDISTTMPTPNAALTFHTLSKPKNGTPSCLIQDLPTPQNSQSVNVYYRPHLAQFISTISQGFDIAIFSTCEQEYVDALLDVMDPSGQVFPKSRRYYRQHCTKVFNKQELPDATKVFNMQYATDASRGGPSDIVAADPSQPSAFLAKDLLTLGLPLSEVVLVDDTVSSGFLQPSNLLLLPTWSGNPTDTALLQLMDKLIRISTHQQQQ